MGGGDVHRKEVIRLGSALKISDSKSGTSNVRHDTSVSDVIDVSYA